MPTIEVIEPEVFSEVIEARQEYGHDLHDEVWDGVYIMMPIGDVQHQSLGTEIAGVLLGLTDRPSGDRVYAGTNITDREPPEDWRENFRIPDVAVFLAGNPAEARGSHYFGGPDLAIEILSKGDRARRKLKFYASVGTRELLLIDRDPWSLELLRLEGGTFRPVPADDAGRVTTQTVPVTWSVDVNAKAPLRLQSADETWQLGD